MDYTNYKFTFGKYKDKLLSQVPQDYLNWCISPQGLNNKPDLINIITNYLNAQTVIEKQPININDSPSITRNYGIVYDEFINFPDTVIHRILSSLNIGVHSINYVMTEFKRMGSNLNKNISGFSNKYFEDPNANYNVDDILLSDLKKVAFAWKYGITGISLKYNDNAKEIQDKILQDWNQGKSVDTIINEFTKELTKEEKEFNRINGIISYRKQCKKIPYLFTPALCQFLMLEVSNTNMKKIYKCYFDQVMGFEKGAFPNEYNRISNLYSIDWKNHYYGFIMNPYAYYNIPIEVCDSVISLTNRSVENFALERKLGEFSRFIYGKSKDDKWNATPIWLIKKEYPDMLDYMPLLRNNYGLISDQQCAETSSSCRSQEYIYLYHIYHEELLVANFVNSNLSLEINPFKETAIMDEINGLILTDEQKNAIQGSLSKGLSIITGLAGTGKSTVIKGIVKILKLNQSKYKICAYTAKAKKRIIQILGDDDNIKTIHSTIMSLEDNEDFPNYIIIDEASMVSLSLLSKLVKLITNKSVSLIMLGDINQLPPIRYGRPFEDLINSKCVDIHKLNKILRIKGDSTDPIIVNSTNIVHANMYSVTPGSNFGIYPKGDLQQTIRAIVQYYNVSLENIKNNKFITYTNDDAIELNSILSNMINCYNNQSKIILTNTNRKDTNENKIQVRLKYSVDDPVIFTKNHVYPGVSNGCEGKVSGFINDGLNYMLVDIGNNRDIRIPLYHSRISNEFYIKHVSLAYAITVYKAQGSEWNNVCFYINGLPSKKRLNKRLAYTAITRSKETCLIVESQNGLFENTCRTDINCHYSGLQNRIQKDNIPSSNTTDSQIQNINNMMKNINLTGNLVFN